MPVLSHFFAFGGRKQHSFVKIINKEQKWKIVLFAFFILLGGRSFVDFYLSNYWNGTSLSGYVAQYRNGIGYVLDVTVVDSEVSVSQGNTIIFTFTRSGSTEIGEIVGSAMENSEDPSQGWMDYVPNDFSPWYGGDEDDDDDTGDDDDDDVIISPNGDDTGGDGNGGNGGGIPGFEAIAVIAAIAVALIILRRKKSNK